MAAFMVPRPESGALYYRPQSQAAAQKTRVAGSHPTFGWALRFSRRNCSTYHPSLIRVRRPKGKQDSRNSEQNCHRKKEEQLASQTAKVRAIPEGFHTVTPHLVVRGAARAIEFYKKAFGAEELGRSPGPQLLGAEGFLVE